MLIFDATPLIYLAKAGILERIESIEGKKAVPREVYEEVVVKGKEVGERDAVIVEKSVKKNMVEVLEVERGELYRKLSENPRLSDADVAVLVLADKRGATAILDDEYARTVADAEGIESRGTVFLLFRLLKDGEMTAREVKETVDKMIESGWYCSTDLYADILNQIEKLGG